MDSIINQIQAILDSIPKEEGTVIKHKVTGELITNLKDLDLTEVSNYEKITLSKEDSVAEVLSKLTGEEIKPKEIKVGKKGTRKIINVDKNHFKTLFKLLIFLYQNVQPSARRTVFEELGYYIKRPKPLKEADKISEAELFEKMEKMYKEGTPYDKKRFEEYYLDILKVKPTE